MNRTITALFALTLAGATGACATDSPDDTAAPRQADGPPRSHAIEFALEPDSMDAAAIDAVAKRVEQVTGAESVSVSVRSTPQDGTVVVIEAWGRAGASDDAIVDDLRRGVPQLANALITVRPLEGEAPTGPASDLDLDADESPDEVRRRVIEKLRADGVKGDIEVIVEDGEGGKREVRVEVEDRQ